MDRPLTPIERMIDAACGHVPAAPVPRILLRCPVCKAQRQCLRAPDIDPPAAVVQEYPCPKCGEYDPADSATDARPGAVHYFDAAGKEIPFP